MKRSSIQRTTRSLLSMRDRIRFDLLFQLENRSRILLRGAVALSLTIRQIFGWRNNNSHNASMNNY